MVDHLCTFGAMLDPMLSVPRERLCPHHGSGIDWITGTGAIGHGGYVLVLWGSRRPRGGESRHGFVQRTAV